MLLEELLSVFKELNESNETIIHHKMGLIKAIIETKEYPEIAAIDLVNSGVAISMALNDPHAAHDLANHLKEQADWINRRVAHLISEHKIDGKNKH